MERSRPREITHNMTKYLASLTLLTLASMSFAQTRPSFQITGVHPSAKVRLPQMQGGGPLQNGRFEMRQATMLDLIRIAYGIDADTVFGGPSWLELDRFDVAGKAPAGTRPAAVPLMLQSLLADRFKLVVHKDTQPIQGFVLSAGKAKTKMKTADPAGEPGCSQLPLPLPPPETPPPTTMVCHNITLEAFLPILHRIGSSYLTGPVLDSTGLKGAWDFELKFHPRGIIALAGTDGIDLFDAIDRQLGLKLEPGKVPMPVLVVDRVNQTPSANPAGVSTALPPAAAPEFEVASLRLSPSGANMGVMQVQPGGRVELHAYPLMMMLTQAWDLNLPSPNAAFAGAPKSLTPFEPLVELIAKAPAGAVTTNNGQTTFFNDDLSSMFRALLIDRYKMKVHYEDRVVDAYSIVSDKPKLKAADPTGRSKCNVERPLPSTFDGQPMMKATCQNTTLAQLADQLQTIAPAYFRGAPVDDASGIQGAFDFTFSFIPVPGGGGGGGRGGTKGGPGPGRASDGASDPSGGVTLFDAFQKQLGLKLEQRKRTLPVFVIDHMEDKPAEN
jgi:uncharacterized protein (TIGR03435 family)